MQRSTHPLPDKPKLLLVSMGSFYPDTAGGVELSYLYLFQSLCKRGWKVEVICNLSPHSQYLQTLHQERWKALVHFQKPPHYVRDEDLGYPCWRGIRSRPHLRCFAYKAINRTLRVLQHLPTGTDVLSGCAPPRSKVFCRAELSGALCVLDRRLEEYDPDIVIGHYGALPLLSHAARQGYLSFNFVRGIASSNGTRKVVFPDEIGLMANSPVVASQITQGSHNEVGVILPFVHPENYRVTKHERRYITFINPIPEKGLDVALEVARRLPAERFLFVKGGWFNQNRWFARRMKPIYTLPNVEVWDYQKDMRHVYAVTDILLVPSRHESFGRVILESHINGIPVIAANVDGIPYTLGKGGILVDPQSDLQKEGEAYANAIRRLRRDQDLYSLLSSHALENSRRHEFDPEFQVENFIHFVKSHI